MCGLVFGLAKISVDKFIFSAHSRQFYRGPDSEGIHLEKFGLLHLGMAHERLSIFDLTESGKQPMLSSSGRLRIIFNGEIYNYKELAIKYGLIKMRSQTDTEVIVELVELLGIDEACRQLNGMWVFIIQDLVKKCIYLSRDRLGKKPLYMHLNNNGIYLTSEMHSLLSLPTIKIDPNPVVAARFLAQSLQNVDEKSWIKGISAFPPATIGEIDLNASIIDIVRTRTYWKPSLFRVSEQKCRPNSELIEELGELVKNSIDIRLNADVPVGVALSGGIDSSIIAAYAAKKNAANGISTLLFSVVNPGSLDDESAHIDTMDRYLNLEVQRFQLNPNDGDGLLSLIKRCTRHNDGPLSSFSNVLFYKLMERARDVGVTVVLTGQGADETFCGYRKYPFLEIKRRIQSHNFSSAISLAAGFMLNGTLIPEFKLNEGKRYLGVYNNTILGRVTKLALQLEPLSQISSLSERQWKDISQYSVPYLCHYEDRMSMAWGREVRSPFLDYRVVELGLSMPEHLKLSYGWTKYALRKAFVNDIPDSIAWRKDKKGFTNPQDEWLRGTLKTAVQEIMFDRNALVYKHELVDRRAYLERFLAYCDGNVNIWFRDVFAPFALELWLREATDISKDMKA
jgi:asparagine synthase (glutamine-hydrolysing)